MTRPTAASYARFARDDARRAADPYRTYRGDRTADTETGCPLRWDGQRYVHTDDPCAHCDQ